MTSFRIPSSGDAEKHAHVVQVAVGKHHSLFLTDEGIVYSWGTNNEFGQLGRACPTEAKMMEPSPVNSLQSDIIVQIACGMNHCLALSQRGVLYAWGSNKAGQLGIDGFSLTVPVSELVQKTPVQVKGFSSQDGHVVRSCSCGPESSSCVTTKGEVFVWGATSFYFFGRGQHYQRGENCTIPVRIRGVPHEKCTRNQHLPDQVALYKDTIAATLTRSNVMDELTQYIGRMKHRQAQLLTMSKMRRNDAQDTKGGELALEELQLLNADFLQQNQELQRKGDELEKQRMSLRAELTRLKRELTVCDQQDAALVENATALEVKLHDVGETNGAQQRAWETKLSDIGHFQSSNRRKRNQLLLSRDAAERDLVRITQELTSNRTQRTQLESRSKIIKKMQGGDFGSLKGALTEVDEGMKVADGKRKELAATDPFELAGNGRFTGLREVLSISDRALQDVSSSLKEVRAAASGRDGPILETVLEENLKLRKEINLLIEDRLHRGEFGGSDTDKILPGLLQFWEECETDYGTSNAQETQTKWFLD